MNYFKNNTWTAPETVGDWARRAMAVRPLLVFLCVSALILSELRFDWMEQTVGTFLVSTNSQRPESGTIWETGRQTRTARKTLEQIVSDRNATQEETRLAESFKEIAATIQPDQWVMIPPDLFRRLYLQLAPEAAEKIISSFDLLMLVNENNWERTYFEKEGDGLNIYILDTENRVLRQLTIPPELLHGMGESQVELDESLDNLEQFSNRIYPAGPFFEVLNRLEERIQHEVIPQPDQLLRVPGQVTRVGISRRAASGFVELGFEIEDAAGRVVVLTNGRENAVRLLRAKLEGREPVRHRNEGR